MICSIPPQCQYSPPRASGTPPLLDRHNTAGARPAFPLISWRGAETPSAREKPRCSNSRREAEAPSAREVNIMSHFTARSAKFNKYSNIPSRTIYYILINEYARLSVITIFGNFLIYNFNSISITFIDITRVRYTARSW